MISEGSLSATYLWFFTFLRGGLPTPPSRPRDGVSLLQQLMPLGYVLGGEASGRAAGCLTQSSDRALCKLFIQSLCLRAFLVPPQDLPASGSVSGAAGQPCSIYWAVSTVGISEGLRTWIGICLGAWSTRMTQGKLAEGPSSCTNTCVHVCVCEHARVYLRVHACVNADVEARGQY